MDYKNFSDISFIEKGINDLERLTEQNKPYTRLVFSKEFYAGRDWLTKQFELLELETSVDEAGNVEAVDETDEANEVGQDCDEANEANDAGEADNRQHMHQK